MSEGPYDGHEITIDNRRFTGVWANAAKVSFEADGFTVDFIRLDPREPRGIVVSRVTVAPTFFRRLVDMMESSWHDWVWSTGPPEE